MGGWGSPEPYWSQREGQHGLALGAMAKHITYAVPPTPSDRVPALWSWMVALPTHLLQIL